MTAEVLSGSFVKKKKKVKKKIAEKITKKKIEAQAPRDVEGEEEGGQVTESDAPFP